MPFFSRPAATESTVARLARRSGPDLTQATRRINRFIEKQALIVPARYLWLQRHFKTRPEGEDSTYQ